MSLGQIHYSEDALKSIIKTEVLSNHPVNDLQITMGEEQDNYVFGLEVSLYTFENVLDITKNMQKAVLETLDLMTELKNVKINVTIKNLKAKK